MFTRNKGLIDVSANYEKFGCGRFLECGVIGARGKVERNVAFWDFRILELINMEVKVHSISCCLKNLRVTLLGFFLWCVGFVKMRGENFEWIWSKKWPLEQSVVC